MYTRFLPAISRAALKKISGQVRGWRLHRKAGYTFAGLAYFTYGSVGAGR